MVSLGEFIQVAQHYFSRETSFHYVLTVFEAIFKAGPLMLLHHLQKARGGRRKTAWLTSVRTIVEDAFQNGDARFYPDAMEEDGLPLLAPNEVDREIFLQNLPEISTHMGWGGIDEPNQPGVCDLVVPPVLVSKHKHCIFCVDEDGVHADLRRSKDLVSITLITNSYLAVRAYLAITHCIRCGVDYHPDRIVRHHENSLRQFYVYDASFLRISKSAMLWIDRRIATAQAQSIFQHQTFSGYANWFNQVYGPGAPDPGFQVEGANGHRPSLTNDQSYRMFVEHMVRRLGLAHPRPGIFHTGHDPTVAEVVKAALVWFVHDGVLPNAKLHSCEDCTHPKRYREHLENGNNIGVPDGAQFAVAGVDEPLPELLPLPAENDGHVIVGHNIEPPVAPDDIQEVNLAVMDGTVAGHVLCNAPVIPRCRRPPSDFKSARFCVEHSHWSLICGINNCDRDVADGSKVCDSPAHQTFYAKFLNRYGGRNSLHTVQRAVERRAEVIQQQAEGGGDGIPVANLPPLPQLPPDDPVMQLGDRVTHTFQAGRVYCVQLLMFSCGYPIAFTKMYEAESESQVYSFIEKVWPDATPLRPTYISYDRACSLLRHIITSHPQSTWIDSTKFIVDIWHYIGHRVDDIMCRTRCNPAPSDGSQPDLIIKERDDRGNTVTKRAFNTETAEQLNAWFGSYKGSLNRMTDYNFDFFIYCVLFLYSENWKYRKGQDIQLAERREARARERQNNDGGAVE